MKKSLVVIILGFFLVNAAKVLAASEGWMPNLKSVFESLTDISLFVKYIVENYPTLHYLIDGLFFMTVFIVLGRYGFQRIWHDERMARTISVMLGGILTASMLVWEFNSQWSLASLTTVPASITAVIFSATIFWSVYHLSHQNRVMAFSAAYLAGLAAISLIMPNLMLLIMQRAPWLGLFLEIMFVGVTIYFLLKMGGYIWGAAGGTDTGFTRPGFWQPGSRRERRPRTPRDYSYERNSLVGVRNRFINGVEANIELGRFEAARRALIRQFGASGTHKNKGDQKIIYRANRDVMRYIRDIRNNLITNLDSCIRELPRGVTNHTINATTHHAAQIIGAIDRLIAQTEAHRL